LIIWWLQVVGLVVFIMAVAVGLADLGLVPHFLLLPDQPIK
jgi:hypothetical protein